MAFNYTIPNYNEVFAPDKPANADDINSMFSDIEDELSGVHILADNSVTQSKIADKAVTQSKINLTGFTPTKDYHPVTKLHLEGFIDDNANQLFGLSSSTLLDSDGSPLSQDVYDGGSITIAQKIYQAPSDGILTVITRSQTQSGALNTVTCRLCIWAGTNINNYTLSGIDIAVPTKSQWDYALDPMNNGAFLMADRVFKGGPVTVSVPIKRGQQFKVLTLSGNDKGNTIGGFPLCYTIIRWTGFGSSNAPVDMGGS